MSDTAKLTRILGNETVHDDNEVLSDQELEILDYFYSSIIEYVNIRSKKIELLKEKLKNNSLQHALEKG